MVIRGEIVKDKVSELTDGELDDADAAKVIDVIKNDDSLFLDWKIYHVIGDSMRQSIVDIDISERIRKKLANEPPLLAPYTPKIHQNHTQKRVGFAIAASVAVLSIGWLISQSMEQRETTFEKVFVAEKENGKAAPIGGRRSLLTFGPIPAYSPPSVPAGHSYHNDLLIYRGLTYGEAVRYSAPGMISPVDVVDGRSNTSTK